MPFTNLDPVSVTGGGVVAGPDNRTIIDSTGSTISVKSNTAHASGKVYVEFDLSGCDEDNYDLMAGIIRGDNTFVVFRNAIGVGLVNAGGPSVLSTVGVVTEDDPVYPTPLGRFGIAIDFDTQRMWSHIDGVYAAGANPTTGANPSVSGFPDDEYKINIQFDNDGASHVVLLCANASEMLHLPSGFQPWGEAAVQEPLSLGFDRLPESFGRSPLENISRRGQPPANTAKNRTRRFPSRVRATYLLMNQEYQAFLEAYSNSSRFGSAWFLAYLPSQYGPQYVNVRVASFSATPVGGQGWRLNLELDLDEPYAPVVVAPVVECSCPDGTELLQHFENAIGSTIVLSAIGPYMTPSSGAQTPSSPGIHGSNAFRPAGLGTSWLATFAAAISLNQNWSFELSFSFTGTGAKLFRMLTSGGTEVFSMDITPFLGNPTTDITLSTGGTGGGAGLLFGTGSTFVAGVTYKLGFQYDVAAQTLTMFRDGVSVGVLSGVTFTRSVGSIRIGLGRVSSTAPNPNAVFDEVIFCRSLLYAGDKAAPYLPNDTTSLFSSSGTADYGTFSNGGSGVSVGSAAGVGGALQVAIGRWRTTYPVSTVDIVEFPSGTIVRSWSTVVSTGVTSRGHSGEPGLMVRRLLDPVTQARYYDQFGAQTIVSVPESGMFGSGSNYHKSADSFYIASTAVGKVRIYRCPSSGGASVATSPDLPTTVTYMCIADGSLFALSYGLGSTRLYRLDPLTLELQATYSLPEGMSTTPYASIHDSGDGGLFYYCNLGSGNRRLWRLDFLCLNWTYFGEVPLTSQDGLAACVIDGDFFVLGNSQPNDSSGVNTARRSVRS